MRTAACLSGLHDVTEAHGKLTQALQISSLLGIQYKAVRANQVVDKHLGIHLECVTHL